MDDGSRSIGGLRKDGNWNALSNSTEANKWQRSRHHYDIIIEKEDSNPVDIEQKYLMGPHQGRCKDVLRTSEMLRMTS